MPMPAPISRYRPTQAQDGEGGWTPTLGTAVTVYVTMEFHSDRATLLAEANEDIATADVLLIDGEYYRVTATRHLPGTLWNRFDLEKTERPVSP
jgi:hypothetical protein